MKAVIVGDIQAHSWSNYGSINADGINTRLLDVLYEFRRIRKFCISSGIRVLIVLGDVFQERARLDVVVQNSILREVRKFTKEGIRVILLLGNHDKYDVGDFHSLEMFKDIATVIDTPRMLDIDGTKVLAIPYIAESKNVVHQLNKYGKKADVILMHVAVQNTKLPSGELWQEGIKLSDIPEKPYTFMGHFHGFKRLRKRVYYLGSMLQVDWSDSGKKKVYAVYSKSNVKFIKTKGPKFLEIKLKDNYREKDLHSIVEGNFVRVRWAGSFNKSGKVKKFIRKQGARSVEIVPTQISGAETDGQTAIQTSKRLEAFLSEELKNLPIDERQPTFELGMEILQKAFLKK